MAFWEPIAIAAVVNAILGLGFYVTLMSGQLSIAHAAAAGIAAYGAAVLTTNFHVPFFIAIVIGMALAAIVGVALGVLAVRMNLLVSSLVTLGFGETMSVIAYNTPYLGGANSFTGIHQYTNLGNAILALFVAAYVVWRFEGSRLGFASRAVRDNPTAAAATGLDVRHIRIVTFAFGTALAGLGGAISAHYVLVINPADLGFFPSFYIQLYAVFGGSYTMWGPILGAGILTTIPQLLRFTTTYRFALYGLVIFLIVVLRPQGLVSRTPTGSRSPLTRSISAISRAFRAQVVRR